MIELIDVTKKYLYHRQTINILSNVNLKIDKGECVCLTMPSGTGKTTLLNIIGGMLASSSGSVWINSTDLTRLPHHFLAAYRLKRIGFIFQQFNLLPHYTVMENLYFPFIPAGKQLHAERERIEKLLDRLKISHRSDFYVNLLSGGEQQRVAVARALINNPDIILADEPFSNLDPENTKFILEIFKELKDEGKTFIISATTTLVEQSNGFIDREITQW